MRKVNFQPISANKQGRKWIKSLEMQFDTHMFFLKLFCLDANFRVNVSVRHPFTF